MNFQSWQIFVDDFVSAIMGSMSINAFMAYKIDPYLNTAEHYYKNIATLAVEQYLAEMQYDDPLNIQQNRHSNEVQVLSLHQVSEQYATFIDTHQIGDNVELYFNYNGVPTYGLSLLRPKKSGQFNTSELAFLKSYYDLAKCYFQTGYAIQQQHPQVLDQKYSLSHYDLTKKQQQVIQLICAGKNNQQISQEMFISISTVKTHIQHIFQKIQVSNKHQLVTRLGYRI